MLLSSARHPVTAFLLNERLKTMFLVSRWKLSCWRTPVDLKDIKAIIDLMKKNSIAEFEMEKQDFKIRLKRQTGAAPAPQYDEGSVQGYLPHGAGMGMPTILPPPSGSPAGE